MSISNNKVLIFGSNGMLGRYVYIYLKEFLNDYEIIPLTRKDFDILNDTFDKLKSLLQKYGNNNIIINCAGVIPQRSSFENFKDFILVNSIFPHKLQEFSHSLDSKLIHITTDCVFDGNKGNYNENDLHTEKNIYGVSKSIGEPLESCVIRTSIIGHELFNKKSLLEWIISKKDNTINGFVNHYWNGVTCLTLSKIIYQIIINNLYWSGIRHIYSPDTLSKYDLCCIINEVYELNLNINKFETTIVDKSLSSIYKNYFSINSLKEQIYEMKKYNIYQ
jgi:dTDP-4-dehydrorhamnose reductase